MDRGQWRPQHHRPHRLQPPEALRSLRQEIDPSLVPAHRDQGSPKERWRLARRPAKEDIDNEGSKEAAGKEGRQADTCKESSLTLAVAAASRWCWRWVGGLEFHCFHRLGLDQDGPVLGNDRSDGIFERFDALAGDGRDGIERQL